MSADNPTPYERSRIDAIVAEMSDGETRLNPMPGIASVTRKDRWEADTVLVGRVDCNVAELPHV